VSQSTPTNESPLHYIFSAQGSLAQNISNFRERQQQKEMALSIENAIQQNGVLVVEAGTGTGKTFAYLVPALLSGGKVIISTGTKTLQDQLFRRDLPAVRDALKIPVNVAMLKGRANYLCHYHFERASRDGRFASREDASYLQALKQFMQSSKTGDKSDIPSVPESATIWPLVTSTKDNCLGQECPHYKDCFVVAARKRAMEADVVVVNHHLFFADVALRDEGVAELLPTANAVIFDEAHQLPEIAGLFFGQDVSTSQLMELSRDVEIAFVTAAKDCAQLQTSAKALDKAARDFRLVFPFEGSRMPAQKALSQPKFAPVFEVMQQALAELAAILETQAARDPMLENCWQRALGLMQMLQQWIKSEREDYVRWVEVFTQSVQLHATPLSVAESFAAQIKGKVGAWIFTSATLAVKNDFSHYLNQMGLDQAQTSLWNSPFNYPEQAMLYVPEQMPDPNSTIYSSEVAAKALPVIRASQGRCFVLCTSLRAMREIHALLKEAFEQQGLDFPLLVQGERSRSELLERFRQLGNAVLVGSQSFWEGVDVRGEALSCVIIDKLPFSPPDDPVLAARIEQYNAQGKNAFMEHQLPYSVITLKQGAGRLIRDEHDRGVLMICDPRLISKSYGKRIWQSLPAFKRTRQLSDVEQFFNASAAKA
jgi:ATP-dependent DNA helicase DinG